MPTGAFNITELLKQLGIKNLTELPIAQVLTPTITVGDGSALTAPLLPPSAWVGATVNADAGERSTWQCHSRGRGGCFIRKLLISGSASGNLTFSVTEADPFAATPLTGVCTILDMAPSPLLSKGFFDSSTINMFDDELPSIRVPTSTVFDLGDATFVPAGWWFSIQRYAAAQAGQIAALIQDVPSAAIAPTG